MSNFLFEKIDKFNESMGDFYITYAALKHCFHAWIKNLLHVDSFLQNYFCLIILS